MKRQFPHDPADIFAALNRGRVKYLVVGGVAAIFHGVPRITFDADIAVDFELENLKRLERAMNRIGFSTRVPVSATDLADPRIRREWTRHKGMKVFAFVENKKPFRMVDVMVRPLPDFSRLYQQRVNVRHQGVTVPLVPLPTLVTLKTGTGRIEDAKDVAYLRMIQQKMKRSRVKG